MVAFVSQPVCAQGEGNNAYKQFMMEIEEIEKLRQEALAWFEKHKTRFQTADFMREQYMNIPNLPEEEIGKSVLVMNEKGHITDFNEWHAHALADVIDIPFGGPMIPGMSTTDGAHTHIHEVDANLRASMEFLTKHTTYYMEHFPERETRYLYDGMDQWRDLVNAYEKDLNTYLRRSAQYVVFNRYYRQTLYDRKIEELNKKFPNREDDPLQKARYTAERQVFEKWYSNKKKEAEEDRAYLRSSPLYKYKKAKIFNDLEAEFGDIVKIQMLNDAYMQINKNYAFYDLDDPQDIELMKELKQDPVHAKRIEELKRIRDNFKSAVTEAKEKYGDDWLDRFRDYRTGNVPGGLLAKEEELLTELAPDKETFQKSLEKAVSAHKGEEHLAGVKAGGTMFVTDETTHPHTARKPAVPEKTAQP